MIGARLVPDRDRLGLGLDQERPDRGVDHLVERSQLFVELDLAGFDAGEGQDVIDHAEQARARLVDVFAVCGMVARRPARLDDLGKADDRVERSAQLVRDVGEEVGLGAIGGPGLHQRFFGEPRRALGVLPRAVQRTLGMTAVEQRTELQAIVVEQRILVPPCAADGLAESVHEVLLYRWFPKEHLRRREFDSASDRAIAA